MYLTLNRILRKIKLQYIINIDKLDYKSSWHSKLQFFDAVNNLVDIGQILIFQVYIS